MRENCSYQTFLDAVKSGNINSIQSLYYPQTYINQQDTNHTDSYQPLHYAALLGHTAMVRFLLDKGANVNAKASNKTPLSVAAEHGKNDVIEILCRKNAGIDFGGMYDDSPLIDAVRGGHVSTVLLLLKKGARVDAADRYKMTALHVAAYDADVNEYRNNPTMPFYYSRSVNNPEIIEILMAYNASNKAKNDYNRTPEEHALQARQSSIAELINRYERERPILRTQEEVEEVPIINHNGLENRFATAAALMTIGTYIFIGAVVLSASNKNDPAYKLAALGLTFAAIGSAISGHETGKVLKSIGHRMHRFFSDFSADVNKVAESVDRTGRTLRHATETARQAVDRLSQTVDECIVKLMHSTDKTLIELRGRGRDVARAIDQGITAGKFKPEAHVNAQVYAAAGFCRIM